MTRSGCSARPARGSGYLWSVRPLRIIALGFCGIVAVNGIDDVALLVLATDTFGAGDSAVALLLGAVGLGLLVGYALLARFGGRVAMPALLLAGFAVSSVGNLLTGLAWAVAVAFALQAVRGLGLAAMDVASNTLLQRLVPDHLLGRVFGNLYGLIGVAAGLSYVAGGLLLDATSAPVTFVAAGAAGTVITVVVAVALRPAPATPTRDVPDRGGVGAGQPRSRVQLGACRRPASAGRPPDRRPVLAPERSAPGHRQLAVAQLGDRDGHRGHPDPDDEQVDRGAGPAGHVERAQDGPGVGEHDDAADRAAQHRRRDLGDQPRGQRGGQHAAEQQAADRPRVEHRRCRARSGTRRWPPARPGTPRCPPSR